MAQRKYTIADALGLSGKTARDLTKGYQREVRAIPRGARYQGAISRSRPTAAQELAQLLTPDTRGGAEFAQKLTPAIENVPLLGGLLSLVDARRQYQAGNTGQAAGLGILAALGAVPGAAGAKAAKEAAETAAERGIIAYHGSPYSFDRFSLSKIGTGEGAQAYGHGLYFAEAEDVAKSYRDALSSSTGFSFNGKRNLTRDDVIKEVEKSYGKGFLDNVTRPSGIADLVIDAKILGGGGARLKEGSERKAVFDKLMSQISHSNPGSMYQVRINANPEDFLDWDKPLAEQPSNVRKAIASALSGGDELAAELLGDLSSPEAMQIAGLLPKSKGSQVYNTLKFNQKPVGFDESGEPLFSGMAALENRNPIAATEAILRAGVPGIKYLDQGSRAAGEGSRNFVVFDDALIEILKKYGIAIPAIAGGGLLATQPQQDGGI